MSRSDWIPTRLAECIATINAGVSVNSDHRPRGPGEIGVLKTSAVSAGSFKSNENKVVAKKDRSRVAESVRGGSVLFSRMNTPQLVGESCYVEADDPSLFLPDRLWQIRVDPSCIDSRWFSYLLLEPHVALRIKSLATGTSGSMKNIAKNAFLGIRVLIPPKPEQQRVAEILAEVDNQIRSSELVLSKLRTAKYGLADHLLTVGVDDSGRVRDPLERSNRFHQTLLGPRPCSWLVAPLRDFLDRSDYGISNALSDTGRIPVLRMNNFADGEARLDELKYSSSPDAFRLTLAPGDVLFNRTNSMEHVGRTGIWRGQLDKVSFASYLVRLVPNEKLTNEYLNRLLNLRQTQIDLRRWATPGVHQVNVNPTNLRRVVVAVPDSLEEQHRICEALAAHDARIEREHDVLSKLRSQKVGLLSDLLTGSVRVPAGAVS